jgi:hypothetical protein
MSCSRKQIVDGVRANAELSANFRVSPDLVAQQQHFLGTRATGRDGIREQARQFLEQERRICLGRRPVTQRRSQFTVVGEIAIVGAGARQHIARTIADGAVEIQS